MSLRWSHVQLASFDEIGYQLVNFVANNWYNLLCFRTAPVRVVFSHTWRRKSSRIRRITDKGWIPVFFLAICHDVRCDWGASSWLRTRSLTSLVFAAVPEVFSLPLLHFRAFVHCSFNCLNKSFKVVFFYRFVGKFFHQSLRSITFEHIQIFLLQEIRSVEHGICPIAEFTSPWLNYAAIFAIRS